MLPPGVSASTFADAIKQFQGIVGKDWVFTSDEDVALYKDAYSPFWGEKEEILVSAAVAPNTAEEVSRVVRVANPSRFRFTRFQRARTWDMAGRRPICPAASFST
jgi:(+)-pinoresinol hydroxylase